MDVNGRPYGVEKKNGILTIARITNLNSSGRYSVAVEELYTPRDEKGHLQFDKEQAGKLIMELQLLVDSEINNNRNTG